LNWKKILSDYAWLIGIALVIAILDQVTKEWVRNNLSYGEVYRPDLWITQYVRILHWQNTGAAFGIFQNGGIIFTILSFFVGAAILYYFPQVPHQEWTLRLAMALQLGGAAGNLIDRLTHNLMVTDFISVGNFPVFNIADACISIGVAVLILGIWLSERREKQQAIMAAQMAAQQAQTDPAAAETASVPEETHSE
jgi:signal peptidase II